VSTASPEAPVQRIGAVTVTTLMTGAPWRENCYVVRDERSGEQIVIDPGAQPERIVGVIEAGGGRLTHVLLTHGHHDHVGAVAAVCEHFGLACELHEADRRLLRHAPMYALRFAGRRIDDPAPARPYAGAPEFALGEGVLQTILTPGHTAGSVCYSLPGLVFTGDTLLPRSVGRTDLPGGDAAVLRGSVGALLAPLAPTVVLFPGHGAPWTAGDAATWWAGAQAAPPQVTSFEH
jgi:glyoxylase-like metal-dependent hydrolase (beta-lactamase superfamily II)